jgi:hypothetical protein
MCSAETDGAVQNLVEAAGDRLFVSIFVNASAFGNRGINGKNVTQTAK